MLDKGTVLRYLSLPVERVQCAYVWIDGTGEQLRAKSRTLHQVPNSAHQLAEWSCDGSSTGLADSDVLLKPVALYDDPFRGRPNKIALCEALLPDSSAAASNRRASCAETMRLAAEQRPWFGLEQEYTLMDGSWPFGWPAAGVSSASQVACYCGVGAGRALGRDVSEAHYRACLFAGVPLAGTKGEAMPAQWEFRVEPSEGVQAADHLWMARYLLQRVSEDFGLWASFEPVPVEGEGQDCARRAHANFSTRAMRDPGGLREIERAIEKLSKRHEKHLAAYCGGNDERRLDAAFSAGVADRAASVRVPRHVARRGCGYFEDRRPPANSDPYAVTQMLVLTVCLDQ